MREWIRVALRSSVVLRGLKTSFLVGPVYIAINHGNAILNGEVDLERIGQMLLTMTVPYMVSTFSSVGAILEMRKRLATQASQDS